MASESASGWQASSIPREMRIGWFDVFIVVGYFVNTGRNK